MVHAEDMCNLDGLGAARSRARRDRIPDALVAVATPRRGVAQIPSCIVFCHCYGIGRTQHAVWQEARGRHAGTRRRTSSFTGGTTSEFSALADLLLVFPPKFQRLDSIRAGEHHMDKPAKFCRPSHHNLTKHSSARNTRPLQHARTS